MDPTIRDYEIEELQKLAQNIRTAQLEQKLSDSALCRKFTGLGSTKTYQRIREGKDLEELDLEKWLLNYRAVWALIEGGVADEEPCEEYYEDLTPVLKLKKAINGAMKASGNDRLVIMEADTGSGKSTSRKLIEKTYGGRVVIIEACVAWNDSPAALLAEILQTFGLKHPPQMTMKRLEQVLAALNSTRTCLIIEEAHHFGPKCLNMLKTLINKTPGEFVLLTLRTLWKRLEREAYEEARQLTGNRLFERIKLDALHAGDVKKMLDRRCKLAHEDLPSATRMVTDHAQGKGNLAFVRDVCRRAVEIANGDPVTLEIVNSAIAQEEQADERTRAFQPVR